LALAQFDWNANTGQMRYVGRDIPYGKVVKKPNINIEKGNPTRLYSLEELKNILGQRGA
jgi:hypothetical protein